MQTLDRIWDILATTGFKVSTDTRKDVSGSVFFALKGETFDGNDFVENALVKNPAAIVTENEQFKSRENVYVVDNTLSVLQKLARRYRDLFNIPILAIGGSNGKTTTRGLVRHFLEKRYKVHATASNLNNYIGLPLSILSMNRSAEIAVLEIGANRLNEHLELLSILNPTHVLVTNNGLDHLEGFGSPDNVIKANEEIHDWARQHKAIILKGADQGLEIAKSLPLSIRKDGKEYPTQLVGDYNIENINRALSVARDFGVSVEESLLSLSDYSPASWRSQLVERDGTRFVVDCYNANPTSMKLALESFTKSAREPRGLILGDMLELGPYADEAHEQVLAYLAGQRFDPIILIGKDFKKALGKIKLKASWFPDSGSTKKWFNKQNFDGHTLLLKGSRVIGVEKILERDDSPALVDHA